MLLEVPGVAWVAITDADLRDYSSMYLVNPSGSWLGHWLESRLALSGGPFPTLADLESANDTVVRIETNYGDIDLELYNNAAPTCDVPYR